MYCCIINKKCCGDCSGFGDILDSAYLAFPALLVFGFNVELVLILLLVDKGLHILAFVVLLLAVGGIVQHQGPVLYGQHLDILHEVEPLEDFPDLLGPLDHDDCPLVGVHWDEDSPRLRLQFLGRGTLLGDDLPRY